MIANMTDEEIVAALRELWQHGRSDQAANAQRAIVALINYNRPLHRATVWRQRRRTLGQKMGNPFWLAQDGRAYLKVNSSCGQWLLALVTELRERGWSLRRIATAVGDGLGHRTVHSWLRSKRLAD
jgi:hypothetical protein